MARSDFRRFRGGEVVTPADLNRVYDELRRWRRLSATGGLQVDNAHGAAPPSLALAQGERVDVQLTGPFAGGYPWQEVLLTRSNLWVATGRAGGPSTGDPAYERRTGDTTLGSGATVYHAVRSRASNQLLFPYRKPAGAGGCGDNGCCPGATFPDTLTGTDSFWSNNYGVPSFSMTRSPGTCVWAGCSVVPYGAGDPPCPDVNAGVALHYEFDARGCTMTVSYRGFFKVDPTTSALYCCPVASGCGDTPVVCGINAFVVHSLSCSPLNIVFWLNATSEPQLVPWRQFAKNPFTAITLTP